MRWWRFLLLSAAVLIAAVAGTVLAIAVNVATGGTAHPFPFIEHHPWRWSAGATIAVAGAGLLVWLAQRVYERRPMPPQTSTETKPANRTTAHGRLAERWDPVELGVHQVIGGGPMPAYIRRPHDEPLRAVLDPAVPTSRLVVVRGGSSTGKTRAAYEAVADRLADWRLDYPLDPGAVAARLEAGIPARTVLWLGELRQYADADEGAAVLGRLADLLEGDGHIIITTVWQEHWNTYTAATRAGPGTADPVGTAGRLLERLPELSGRDPASIDPARGGVIDVPTRFTAAEMAAAARTSDSVLAEAAAAAVSAGQNGQVTQYLAGVPDLLRRYDGPGGDPYGQAVIAAAMDATRLGHAGPLPAVLLLDAAVGYLTGPQRTKDVATWCDTALAWATDELRGAVRALQAVPPAIGTGMVGYQVADYLDQHGRRTRQDQLGPPSLWEALIVHATGVGDLIRLGYTARDCGLYRHAAALWTTAATLGNTDAACRLLALLRQVSPGDTTRTARWAASEASLDNPVAVARLLDELREEGDAEAVRTLAMRAASHVSVGDPWATAILLWALCAGGADHAVDALLSRDPAGQVGLDNLQAVAELLGVLRAAGAADGVQTLAARVARQASLSNSRAISDLVWALHDAGASDAVRTLAARAADNASLDEPGAVALLLRALGAAGAVGAVGTLAARVARQASLDDPWAVTELLWALRAGATGDAVDVLLARDPARQVSLDNPRAIARLLDELRREGDGDAVRTLAARVASQASLADPSAIAELLWALRAGATGDAVDVLLARDPARQVSLDNPRAIAELLGELRSVGAVSAACTLAARVASQGSLDEPWAIVILLRELHAAGDARAVRTLAVRAASHASLDEPWAIADLLWALHEAGAADAVDVLLARDPAGQVSLGDPSAAAILLRELRAAGDGDAVGILATRAANQGSLGSPRAIAKLLDELRAAGDTDAVRILAARAASHASLDDPSAIAKLLGELHAAGARDAVDVLLARDPAGQVSLDDPSAIAELVGELHAAGATDTVGILASRAARHASLGNSRATAELLGELHAAGARDAVAALATRTANAGMFDLFLKACPDEASSYPFGREPDGAPSPSWRWNEPANHSRRPAT